MAGAADFIAAVLALPNLDCLIEMQDASGNPVDSSPNGFDMTSISGTVTYQVAGPDGGTDFGISFNPGTTERSSPMNTNTVDWAFGCWVRWLNNSVNQAMVENGNPGSNGYGALLVAAAAIRGIAHGIGFKGTTTSDLGDGLWQFVGFQCTAGGSWEVYFGGVADAGSPIGSGAISAPTTKFVVARDGAQLEMAYLFSVSEALDAATWQALYEEMVGAAPVITGAAVVGQTLTSSAASTYQWETSPDGIASWTPIGGETANTYLVDVSELGNWLRVTVSYGGPDLPSAALGPVIPALTGAVVVAFDSGDVVDSFSANDWTPDTSGVLAGDLMIASLEVSFTAAAGITAPAGWVQLDTGSAGGSALSRVYTKFSYEDTPTEVFAFASAAQYVGVFQAVRGGFNASTPITSSVKTTNNTLGTVTYEDQDLALGITLGFDPSSVASISVIPAGFTNVREEASGGGFAALAYVIDATKLEATGPGNTTGLSFTYAIGTDVYTLTILIEFNPGNVPETVTPPIASGSVTVDGTVTTTNGNWSNTPTSFTYQWQSSSDGISGWSNIVGATSASYLVDFTDSLMFLRDRVTASNAEGAGVPEDSNVLGPVEPFPTVTRFSLIG